MATHTDYNNSYRHKGGMDRSTQEQPRVQSSGPPVSNSGDSWLLRTLKEAGKYLWDMVVKPNLLKLADDMIVGAKDQIIWKGKRTTASSSSSQFIPTGGAVEPNTSVTRYKAMWLDSAAEATSILNALYGRLQRNDGIATCADLYEILRVPSYFTDNNWGWKHMRGADAAQSPGGKWYLILPEPEALK